MVVCHTTMCEDRLQANSTHWVVRRDEIELTGPQLGVGGWATVTVVKFRGIQVAVKRIHDEVISRHNFQLFQRVNFEGKCTSNHFL